MDSCRRQPRNGFKKIKVKLKLLVIGSKGFIGSYVSYFYENQNGYDVYACDVGVDYSAKKYFQVDASNADFSELFEQQKFDFCINCSGAASVPDSIVHPLRDFYLNTVNVFKILEAIRRHNSDCKLINLSSAAVYGNPSTLPIKEDNTVRPLSPYGCHKQQSEQICEEFHSHFGIATCSLRIFSAYGPGLKKQLLWDIWQKIQVSSSVVLFGTGNETREFIYISDLTNAIHCVLQHAEFKGEKYNIANGKPTTIRSIANIFSNYFNNEIDISFSGEERKGDPLYWQADITTIKSFGYNQNIEINVGVQNYIQWINEQR